MNYKELNIFRNHTNKKKSNKPQEDWLFKIDDMVSCTRFSCYDMYEDMAKHMQLKNWSWGNSLLTDSKEEGFLNEFTVIAKSHHLTQKNLNLYGIRNIKSGNEYIVNEKAIQINIKQIFIDFLNDHWLLHDFKTYMSNSQHLNRYETIEKLMETVDPKDWIDKAFQWRDTHDISLWTKLHLEWCDKIDYIRNNK